MRLILSSRDFRGEASRACILRNLPRPIAECRVLFIPNEKATAESIASGRYHSRLAEFGFSREMVTVYNPARAGEFFGLAIDVIYVSGGNTFATLERVRREGFDRELVRLIRAGTTYIGGSAGAHLVTQSVEHLREIDENRVGLTDFCGLGLLNGVLICHYCAGRAALRDRLQSEGRTVYPLTDEKSLCLIE